MTSFNPFNYPVLFSAPKRLVDPNAWVEHIPFAMFLMDITRPKLFVELGTHSGNSYCAFCQANQELQIDAKCYAVDTWEGDPQASFYGPKILADLRLHHDELYAGFSNLLQTTFDEAIQYFSDGTIDLLHIDGCHTYEMVKHDFENWLPKLSKQGVVLLHDTNEHARDFGVWKLWDELKEIYPSFEFYHGHGLGILAAGSQYPASLDLLFKSNTEAPAIREFFYLLGSKLDHELSLKLQTALIDASDQSAQFLKNQIAEADLRTQLLSSQLAEQDQTIQALRSQSTAQDQTIQALRSQSTAQDQTIQALKNQITEGKQTVNELVAQGEQSRKDLVEITSSKAWKIGLYIRKLRVAIAPQNSIRYKLLKYAYKLFLFPIRKLRYGKTVDKKVSLINSSGLFEPAWYLEQNPDVALAKVDPVYHYLISGGREGRDPHPLFDSSFYLDNNPDVAASAMNPLLHYSLHGGFEGRNPHPLFDSSFYLESNPDVVASGMNPLRHFTEHGGFEGCDPHPLFDSSFYLAKNPDVAASGMNPLVHYLQHGGFEGRDPHPEFDSSFYLESNPDIVASGMNPLLHYVSYGIFEGRNPNSNSGDSHFHESTQERLQTGQVSLFVNTPNIEGVGSLEDAWIDEEALEEISDITG